jgi:hypothetical protein
MKQLNFDFCERCGSYIQAGCEQVLSMDGKLAVLCPDCARSEDHCEDEADEFARKYGL